MNEQIGAITHTIELFEIDREILNSNLYGVDINEESIEVSKLSLWLKTAKRGKALHSREANLRVGNSVITVADGGAKFSPRAAYVPQFESCKAYFPEFALSAQFSLESSPFYCGNKCYFVPAAAHAEIALFNSKTLWFFFLGLSTSIRNGWREQRGDYLERLPIPLITSADRAALEARGRICHTASEERREVIKQFGHEVLRDLASSGSTSKRPGVLQDWAPLDFAGFTAAVKKHFKQDIPLNDRNAWEAKLKTGAARVAELTTQIKRAEREIDQIVYRLFDLTPDEIALIEVAVK